ncbi:hypothetical protein N7527_001295 [Penicillium freii]|nr:hypothetical protein N7527_001295 [Penicillium freii]
MTLHFLPFAPIFSGYYVLAGAELRDYLWIVDNKHRNRGMPATTKGLRFGEIVLPQDRIGDEALRMTYDDKDWQRFAATPILFPDRQRSLIRQRCHPLGSSPSYRRLSPPQRRQSRVYHGPTH